MNKKGQAGILSFIFGLIIFLFIWAIWLGAYINEKVAEGVASGSFVGFEAFLLSYMNLWIFFGLVISVVFVVYGGRTQ